jgi:HK97 family phage portal protein
MRWPWNKREQKSGSLVQYPQGGIYYLGTSGAGNNRLRDYAQAYRLCDTIYSCVNLIVQSAVPVPWYVYRDTADGEPEEVDKHPLVDWMKNPGEGMDWTEFQSRVYSFYELLGNTYIHKLVGTFGKYGKVGVFLPQLMTPKWNNDGTLNHYEYRIGGLVYSYPPEQIIHVKTFNPENPLIGLPPTQVLAGKIDISRFGELWTIALLENEARPSGALTTDKGLNAQQREVLKQSIKDNYSGYQNAGRPLVLEAGLKWQSFSFTPKELEFINSRKITMREICAAYKVPPELLGDNENKTYSNIKEARKALYQEAVMPLLDKFKDALNRELVPLFDQSGVYLDYDVSAIDALSEDLNALWTRLLAAYDKGTITRNELRTEIGYGELEGPDVISEPVSAIITPVDEIGKEEPEPMPVVVAPPAASPDEPLPNKPPKKAIRRVSVKGGFWQKSERKEAKWNAFARRVQARQRAIEQIAKKYLGAQADRIAKEVRKAPSVQMLNQWGILDKQKEAELYAEIAYPWYADSFKKAVASGMAAGKGEIFDGESKAGFWTEEFRQKVWKLMIESGTKISETTMEKVMDMLEGAEMESMTVNELAQKIKVTFDEFSHSRARRIARTEAAKVENAGELEGYRNTEFVELKGWLCAFVELSREAHMQADADYSDNPIELDEDFIVGGEGLMHPGDPKGSPANVIQCLCTLFPQVKEL